MSVQGRCPIAVVDDDGIAIAADPSRFYDDTTVSSMDRCPVIDTDINTGMKNLTAKNRMFTVAKG